MVRPDDTTDHANHLLHHELVPQIGDEESLQDVAGIGFTWKKKSTPNRDSIQRMLKRSRRSKPNAVTAVTKTPIQIFKPKRIMGPMEQPISRYK